MSFRNLSPLKMFQEMAVGHHPELGFEATTKTEWEAWRTSTWPRVKACLGDDPPGCEPDPMFLAEWEHDGLIKQKWLIDVQPGLAATLLLAIPKDIDEGEKRDM